MESTSQTAASSIGHPFTSSALAPPPTELSDAELLTATRGLVGRSNQLAMRALVAVLERQKYAVTARPRRFAAGSAQPESAHEHESEYESQAKLEHESEVRHEPEPEAEPEPRPEHPRRRGRRVPAAIRRAVFERDEGRCTYASYSGERCRETALLELHHSLAFARGGEHRLENVTLRCRAHNTLAAEQDFGTDFVGRARDSTQHERWSVHDAGSGTATRKGFK